MGRSSGYREKQEGIKESVVSHSCYAILCHLIFHHRNVIVSNRNGCYVPEAGRTVLLHGIGAGYAGVL